MKKVFLLGIAVGALLTAALDDFHASPPMESLQTDQVTQIGLVVENIEEAAENYADILGMEVPDIITTDPLEKANTRFHGSPTEARAKLAFFRMDNITIELIEPVGGPSTWREFLEQNGPGVHHIAFNVDDMRRTVQFLEQKGATMVQRGDFTGGSYAYVDAGNQLHVILELLTSTD
jgi:catechol 2,3-dioxygenase-like lactoylglutathione lyase family enzyme